MLIRDPQILSKIAKWREMEANGTLTIEDCKEIVQVTRQGRTAAAEAARTTRAKGGGGKKVTQTAEEMLDEIDKL